MTLASTRLGYVYRHDDRHYSQDDLRIWLPIFKSLNTRWLTLYASSERTIPESFLTGILGAGIEPIIVIRGKLGEANPNTMQPILRSYARWGVHYVAVHDRPNLRGNWTDVEWNNNRVVERFLDHTIPLLELQQSIGLTPIFTALEPGGDYWDTAFLRTAFEVLVRRGKSELFEKLHLGAYAWTYDKPLDWGTGGQSRWPEARPYHTPSGCQDQIGFRTFEWYADLANYVIGQTLPVLIFAGGAIPDPSIYIGHSQAQIEQNVSILRALSDLPEFVRNFSFDCLTAVTGSSGCNAAWFTEPTKPTPIVDAIQKILSSQEKSPSISSSKMLDHYILLPDSKHLNSAIAELTHFIQTHKPILGFSKNEARMAQKVTLVGGENEFPKDLERELVDTGCVVDRIVTQEQAGDTVLSASAYPPAYPQRRHTQRHHRRRADSGARHSAASGWTGADGAPHRRYLRRISLRAPRQGTPHHHRWRRGPALPGGHAGQGAPTLVL